MRSRNSTDQAANDSNRRWGVLAVGIGADFIGEILSPSTAARDRGIKFEDYAAHGVGEYWLLDPEAEVVEQYVLEAGRYVLRLKSGSGEIESVMIDGLLIPVRALFDDAVNLREVQRIVQDRI